MEFTAGYIFKALTTASVKKLIKPKPTPCFVLNVSLCSSRRAKIGDISTSLKVVNMAVVFLASTKRSATLRRSIDILVLLEPLLPPVGVPIDGTAFTASSLVIRPSFPVPGTVLAFMPFSAKIFLAAGLAEPVAYVLASATAGFGASAFGASSFFSALGALPSGFAALVSIKQTTAPTATASPSSAFSVIIPLASAGSSSVALSLSTSAMA